MHNPSIEEMSNEEEADEIIRRLKYQNSSVLLHSVIIHPVKPIDFVYLDLIVTKDGVSLNVHENDK